MSDTKTTSGGIGLCGALFILFLGLRLTDHIDWAWYWISAPLWIPMALVLAIVAVAYPVTLLFNSADERKAKRLRAEWEAKRRGVR